MNLFYLITSLLISSTFGGVKDLLEHYETENQASTLKARGLQNTESFGEDTVTNDLIPEGEDEDYKLDLDEIFSEYDYSDVIDAPPEIKNTEKIPGNVFELFPGRTRIQRLNIINANFGFDLYRTVKETTNATENILLAPVGVSTALSIVSMGAKGQTQSQILSTLGFQNFINASSKYNTQTIHDVFRKLTHRLVRRDFGYTLRTVNDLYIKNDFSVREDFKNNVKNYYFAEAQIGDFDDNAFIDKANQRIQKLTKGLIKEALSNLNPGLLMFLINCLYFKGTWENKFQEEYTHSASFYVADKEVVKVPMMKTKGNFLVAEDTELECVVLQLPYVGNISMLIAMPHKHTGMKILEKQLSSHLVEKWRKIMANRTREIFLPRFKLAKNYNLKDVLSSMGAKDLFTLKADFSGISDEEINIGMFQQQGSITVNEEGTQAATITVAGFTPLSVQTRVFINRPFLFMIYEHRTNCLIFCGRVSNPTKS